MSITTLDQNLAEETLMDLLRIPGLSGKERQVSDAIRERLLAAGCKAEWMHNDDAHTRIPGDFEIGNLIVTLPGTLEGPRLMFAGHLDTVPLVRGVEPRRLDRRIVPAGDTALGADNRTACAAILTLAETLLRHDLPHPPLTLLFTVGEEIGLWGAKEVDVEDLGHPAMGFNIDSGDPCEAVIGAIGAHRWRVEIKGTSAHAGVHPEHGVSANLIAARAIAAMAEQGVFGLIEKNGRRGTSNVGSVNGGEASNQVTDRVEVTGESRSHDPDFLKEITGVIEACFREAAASVTNHVGKTGEVVFHCNEDYHAFRISDRDPVVTATQRALETLGLSCQPLVTNGGLDANFLNLKGVPTVTLGAGQHNPHTVDEYADLDEYTTCCRLLLQLVEDACA